MSKKFNKEIMVNSAIRSSVNFFGFDRQLPSIVESHMVALLNADAIKTEYAHKIEKVESQIETLRRAETILSESATPVDNSVAIAGLESQIEDLETERDSVLEERAKFKPCEQAKTLKKALSKCALTDKYSQKEAVVDFFMEFVQDGKITREQLESDCFIEEVVGCFGGKHSNKALVQSGTNDARILDVSNAMKMVYDTFFTYGVVKGTVKPAIIPYILFDKYVSAVARKEAEKKAKNNK